MSTTELSKVDQRLPFGQNLLFALQHVFVMVAGAVAVPMIVGGAAGVDVTYLISCALLAAGVATLMQCLGIGKVFGAKIAVIEGTSFAAVSAMKEIAANGGETGLREIAFAVIVAGAFCFLFAGVWGRLLKFFPPVVTGTVVTVIGVSLFPVGIRWIDEIPNINHPANAHWTPELISFFQNHQGALVGRIVMALVTIALVVLFNKVLKGMLNNLAILFALLGGTVICWIRDVFARDAILAGTTYKYFFNTPVMEASWFDIPMPFHYGPPVFSLTATISIVLVMLVIMTEATANMIAVHNMSDKKLESSSLTKGLRASGLSTMFSGAFNSYPVTPFAQNVGMLSMTGVYSRFVTATAGGVLVILSFFPKFGALFASIPKPVLGGAGFAMFGIVAAGGIRTLGKVNYDGNKNALIVAISLGVSMIPVVDGNFFKVLGPEAGYILHSGITLGCISAILLNIIFNMIFLSPQQKAAREKEKESGQTPGH